VLHALRCKAAMPDATMKEAVWQQIVGDAELTNSELYALADTFFRHDQVELTTPFVERYFSEIPGTVKIRNGWLVERTAENVYPRYAVSEGTAARAQASLDSDKLEAGLRRAIGDATDDLQRALRSRQTFPR
jgi:aminopeptidase N